MHADDTNYTVIKNGIVVVSGTGPANLPSNHAKRDVRLRPNSGLVKFLQQHSPLASAAPRKRGRVVHCPPPRRAVGSDFPVT